MCPQQNFIIHYKREIAAVKGLEDNLNSVLVRYKSFPDVEAIASMPALQALLENPNDYVFDEMTRGKTFTLNGLPLKKSAVKEKLEVPQGFADLETQIEAIKKLIAGDYRNKNLPNGIKELWRLYELIDGKVNAKEARLQEIRRKHETYLTSPNGEAAFKLVSDIVEKIESEKLLEKIQMSMYQNNNADDLIDLIWNLLDVKNGKIVVNTETLLRFDKYGRSHITSLRPPRSPLQNSTDLGKPHSSIRDIMKHSNP